MKIKGCKRSSYLELAILNSGQSILYLLKYWDK